MPINPQRNTAAIAALVLVLLQGCVAPHMPIEDELNSALHEAQSKLAACGVATPNDIAITEVPIDRTPSHVICAFSMPGLPHIYLNQGRMLFYPTGPCGPDYTYTIAHELLHVTGLKHETNLEMQHFMNILHNCDLLRKSDYPAPSEQLQ